MTRIIEFLIALGIVAGLFVIIGVVLPGERHISESIETNRKMTIVYDTVNSLRRFKDWNPLLLRDPATDLKFSGPAAGVGATLDYTSKDLGNGTWKITESEQNKRVAIAIEDATKGHDKTTAFILEPTGKDGRNVKITQEYNVKYGFDLFGRYAGLYVSRHIGDDLKMGLSRMANMLATVPNVDYRTAEAPLNDLAIVDVPAEDLLVVTAGNVDRGEATITKSIADNQEWIKRVMEANDLEAVGPFRIITTDFGAEKYAFDVAQPVKKKGSEGVPAEELAVKIDGGAPVKYVRVAPHRSAHATYTGHVAGLDVARNALRAWSVTGGNEVIDRPYETWNGGVQKSFTPEGTYDIYWAVK
ncbi:SRPBCC family protein [Stenotrophomonas sp. Sa5BUN4]|uniref:SRPBCC family protein n=1 Tax=Stenotrophomonas lacuserhaii TaxID=2760084 RepID=A0A8X8FW41_9GAMM|nr:MULTISPECIES: SRPBCC family protein [Stenotrophomonas]MBD7954876.1 SRPBCC family protein [Stenotrophomonas pennii]MDX3931113.1 SRPBCC family protein [Stenotrophomonas sp.]PKH70650.1 polyketide cyclase [Stenotrophomonas sp. Betaine-02u-23]PKH74895.1 polyketide cyclase [Stenotrophomonas sp. Betaine-02u-21]PKH95483.1 polyketide cyclase [Stenotrophomonas sp. Bg11-02]